MSRLCWNCQGAGNPETVRHLRGLRRKYFSDFLFLMETKQKCDYVTGLQKSLGYDHLITVEPVGLSGGLAVMWKQCYNVEILICDKRIIDMKVKCGSLSFFLTCVYGDPVRAKCQEVWDRLVDIGLRRDESWVLAGDFNELMSNEEKLGGSSRDESSFWRFRNMAENCKIKEIRSSGNSFSWGGWRDDVWIQCKLDRSFGNGAWFRLFPRAHMEYLDLWASDHRAIRISFALERDDPHKGRFYFDKRMIEKVGFEEIVRQGWLHTSGPHANLIERISRCRRAISRWKKRADLNSRDTITRLKSALEIEVAKVRTDYRIMQRLRTELAEAFRQEELFWRQKCREEWLRLGDRNTKYFYNCVKGKKLQNRVLMLLDDLGNEHFSEGAKGNIAVDYFRELFMSTNPSDLETLFHGFNKKVTDDMNTELTRPVTIEEIKQAAFRVKGSSAPGEDGLTWVFYQKFWHIVGPAVTEEVLRFFSSAVLPEGWNHTQLSLIPKIIHPTKMQDMRPISLCSVQYKIISKILCDRLKSFLPQLVSETQGAFVSGRLISDNIIIVHEMVHSLRTNQTVAKDFMAIKTDMSKAYDRVEWCFLEILLEKFGFDRVWVRWILSCVSTVTYSVLINGSSHGFIKPEGGLRQGDPLSPFLFILCAEALVNCLNHAEATDRIHGINIAHSGPAVHHLLFADDSLLLCRASVEEAEEIIKCLKLYGDCSGQVINHSKSSIIFGAYVPADQKERVKRSLGIEKEGGDGSYLGLPECFSGSKRKLLSFLREKLQGRLNGWFAKSLSQGGKELLLKSVALALPVYAMSCFKLPKNVCAKLTSAMTEFWWSSGDNRKRISWVAWQKLCKSKEMGGLGFRDIAKFNQSLLGKQAWRVWQYPNSLLSQLLKHRYFKNGNFLDCSLGTRPSYAWRSILHGRELLAQGLVQTVGNGSSTRVFTDNWIADPIPRAPLYKPDSVVDLSLHVENLIDVSGQWNSQLIRQVIADEDVELILKIRPNISRPDSKVWCFSKDGEYTTKTGYQFLETLQEHKSPNANSLPPIEKKLWSDLWKTKTAPKIRHFLWRALSGALAVKERLQSRGILLDTTCPSCDSSQETICHVLFTCSAAKAVWDQSGIPKPNAGFSPNSVFLNLYHLLSVSKNQNLDSKTRRLFPWVLWHIWKARNSLVYEQTKLETEAVWSRAKEDAEVWLSLHGLLPAESLHHSTVSTQGWIPPPIHTVKCNVGSSWFNNCTYGGVSWIVRNHQGTPLFHSRRSFSAVQSHLDNDLRGLLWAIESMISLRIKDVIFETSSVEVRHALLTPLSYPWACQTIIRILDLMQSFDHWSFDHTSHGKNRAAGYIAASATCNRFYQSYVAHNGPHWLQHIILDDALAA